MHGFVLELEQTVEEYLLRCQALSEEERSSKLSPNKWRRRLLEKVHAYKIQCPAKSQSYSGHTGEVQWTYSGDTVELLSPTLPVPCVQLLLRLYPPVLLTGMRVVQECFQTKKELVGHLIDSAQNNIPVHCGGNAKSDHI